tara:strand:- start:13422 stop:13910 length:489 start_codon:yes stop_codon:yes gene_type:complete
MKEITPKEEAALTAGLIPTEEIHTPSQDQDRLTARLDVYYEQAGSSPSQVSCSFATLLPKSEEQVYVRKINIEEEWKPLDLGWVENVGTVVLENRKKIFQTVPTTEEIKAEEKKVVFIRNKKETIGWAIPSGGFFIAATKGEEIEVRCLSGSTKAVVNVFPG